MLIGAASDSDVCVKNNSLAEYHARIEKKPDGFYLINLHGEPDVLVNGVEITFQRLNQGDQIEIGGVSATIRLEGDDKPPVFDKHMPDHVEWTDGQRPPEKAAEILSIISFVTSLTVVGAPISILLGLITLLVIRKRGGTRQSCTMAKWSIGLGVLWMMAGAVAAVLYFQKFKENELFDVAVVQENTVILMLKGLVCAQRYAHTIECFDVDSDGDAEYGSLAELNRVNPSFFDADLADGEACGYKFFIRKASEIEFLAIAEPVLYGTTGLRTFSANQTGQICGKDLGGECLDWVNSYLPILKGEKNAYYEADDAFARDVLNYIKLLPSSLEDQEKRQRIMKRLREEYILRSAEQKLDEQYAGLIYSEAKHALEKGEIEVALAKQLEITERYSFYSKIAAVQRDVGVVRSKVARLMEQRAMTLLTQAEELMGQGKLEEVREIYQQIETLYPTTDVTKRIATLKPELQRQLREKDAESIYSSFTALLVETDYEDILNLANQLHQNYSDTELFSRVQMQLSEREKNAVENLWRARAQKEIEAGHIRGALTQLETAEKDYPDLPHHLQDIYIPLYRGMVNILVEENNPRDALEYVGRLNELLMESTGEEFKDKDLLAQLHRDVGQADYKLENYNEALKHLSNAAWKYTDDAQFEMQLGAAYLRCGLYHPAETALNWALELNPNLPSALLYSAYLNLRVALVRETMIASKLGEGGDEGNDTSIEYAPTDINILLPVDRINNDISTDLLSMLEEAVQLGMRRDLWSKAEEEADAEIYKDEKERRLAIRNKFNPMVKERIVFRKKKVIEFEERCKQLLVDSTRDFEAREFLCGFIKDTERQIRTAVSQMKAAEKLQPSLAPLNATVVEQCRTKQRGLLETEGQISAFMKYVRQNRKRMFDAFDEAVDRGWRIYGRHIEAFKEEMDYEKFKSNDKIIEHAVRKALTAQVDIDQIIRTADGLIAEQQEVRN